MYVAFLGRVDNSIAWDELATFLGRNGHRSTGQMVISGKVKILGGMNFKLLGGRGQIFGGYIPPRPTPCFGTIGETNTHSTKPEDSNI